MRLGRDEEAARWLLEAYDHAVSDPKAAANKALAHLLLGENQRAVDFARTALAQNADNELLASYLIQGLSRIPEIDDPMEGIPAALKERAEVMLAEAMFHRNRGNEDLWIAKMINARRRHGGVHTIALYAAEADIAEVCKAGQYQTTRRLAPDVVARLLVASSVLQAQWDEALTSEQAISDEPLSLAVSSMIGWQLSRECEKACAIALQIVDTKTECRYATVHAAQILADNGRHADAARAIALAPETPSARWMKAMDLINSGNWSAASVILSEGEIPETEIPLAAAFKHLAPFKDKATTADSAALRPLLATLNGDVRSLVVLARVSRGRGEIELATEAFDRALSLVDAKTNMAARLMAASYASDTGNATVVIDLIDDVIPTDRLSDELVQLADAHASETPKRQRNKAFFDRLSPSLRSSPVFMRAEAVVLLDAGGHLDQAINLLCQVRAAHPKDALAVIRLAHAFERNRDQSKLKALTADIDPDMLECHPVHRMAVAHILRSGGRTQLALAEAYRALREAPYNPQVTLGYVGLIMGDRSELMIPNPEAVATDCFVKLEEPNGGVESFIVDTEPAFWGIDTRAPDHPRVQRLIGKKQGDTVEFSRPLEPVETWTIKEVTSKYLHVLHTAMQQFESRFDGYHGLASITTKGEDIGPILDMIRTTAESNREKARHYSERQLPLEFVARMLGGDVLSFADYVRSMGGQIFTSIGTALERNAGIDFALRWRQGGVVLDTYTAVVAARIDVLPILKKHFTRLYLPQSTVDLIDGLIRKEEAKLGTNAMSMSWHDGQFYRHVTADDDIKATVAHLVEIRQRLIAETTVQPVLLPDNLSSEAAGLMQKIGSAPLLPIYMAQQKSLPLLSDDAIYRLFAKQTFAVDGVWMQAALIAASRAPLLTAAQYREALIGLAAHRHDHVAICTPDLLYAYHADSDATLPRFTKLAGRLGGPSADMHSHANVVIGALSAIWDGPPDDSVKRAAATSVVLRSVIRGRRSDYADCLGYIAACSRSNEALIQHISGFITGHFLPHGPINEAFKAWCHEFQSHADLDRLKKLPARRLYFLR